MILQMNKYFNIKLEFQSETINKRIVDTIGRKDKGYVCVVDGNVLATSHKDIQYRDIINNAMVNTCDGSSIARFAGIIHREKFDTYTGPEFFSNFTSKPYRQLFLGNTAEIHTLLKEKFESKSIDTSQMFFETLPFKKVEEFEYEEIAEIINSLAPDIVWVSLGAPKQEMFIHRIFPYINHGVLIAIGAAFNLYVNNEQNKRAPSLFLKLKLEWLYRSYKDPSRVGIRALKYALLIPRLITTEIKTVYFSKHNSL